MTEDVFTKHITSSTTTEEKRKQQVLAAASRVFARLGYAATIDQIAREIGVTKGRVYYYFKSKQDILFHIFRQAMNSFLEEATAADHPDLPADQRLRLVLTSHIYAICENRAVMTVFMDLRRELLPEHWREVAASRKRYELIIQNLIREGIKQGYFIPENEKVLSYTILGSINWVYVWFRDEGELNKEQIAHVMTDYLLHGLRRRTELSSAKLGRTINEISVGDSASFSKTVSETDVYLFAGITGDFNPVHVNEEFAKKTLFGKRIAHGGITTSLIAPVLGTILPGLGTIALETTCRFKAPVFPGDTITASATVLEKDETRNRVRMDLKWENQDGVIVAKGEAVVMPPKEEYKDIFGL
ncbi:MAG TPA: MaoC/PaaZ C-terminal domain-containing protein [Candidatus Limnocylindrales bacterium]|nr:MaoC/PaaZ C-terminal domain-containing protein [Candidatus Limnocylindrales bacterium]